MEVFDRMTGWTRFTRLFFGNPVNPENPVILSFSCEPFSATIHAVSGAVPAAAARKAAAAHLIGTHDFMSLCANKRMKKSTVRTIESIRIEKIGGELRFTVTGDGFLYNMVRILVGTLLEVGMGKRNPDSMPDLLEAKDRSKAGYLVPPHGLRLEAVYYD